MHTIFFKFWHYKRTVFGALLALAMSLTLSACPDEVLCKLKTCNDWGTSIDCGQFSYDEKEPRGCCNGEFPYHTKIQRCENGVIEAKCGNEWYVPAAGSYCVDGAVVTAKGEFTDARDGKVYKYVTIGGANWMAENLNYASENSRCYNDDPANCEKHGRLYYCVTALEACPSGWRLSNASEWEALLDAVGGGEAAAVRLRTGSWPASSSNRKYPSMDDYGFSALPVGTGWLKSNGMVFGGENRHTNWWATRGYVEGANEISSIYGDPSIVLTGGSSNYRVWEEDCGDALDEMFYSNSMYSVRCVQGDPPPPPPPPPLPPADQSSFGTLTDSRDGKTYRTVKIGTQTWMAENLNYDDPSSKYDSKCGTAKGTLTDDNTEFCDRYGRLYQKGAAIIACPSGWHLPSASEWDKLLHYADGTSGSKPYYESQTAGEYLKAKEGWASYRTKFGTRKPGNGTDRYGFAALPGGYGMSGEFAALGIVGYWWMDAGSSYVWREMYNTSKGVMWNNRGNTSFFSVRCVKN